MECVKVRGMNRSKSSIQHVSKYTTFNYDEHNFCEKFVGSKYFNLTLPPNHCLIQVTSSCKCTICIKLSIFSVNSHQLFLNEALHEN